MRTAVIAAIIFVAGITPGLLNHGRPLPNSGRNIAQPVAANTAAAERPTLLTLLSRWKKA